MLASYVSKCETLLTFASLQTQAVYRPKN